MIITVSMEFSDVKFEPNDMKSDLMPHATIKSIIMNL